MQNTESDPVQKLKPFLGKAKELPERSQEVIRHAFSTAEVVEDAGGGGVHPCPVCGVPIEESFIAIKLVGRKAELIPKQVSHMVLAHDFWHPSLDILIKQPPAIVDRERGMDEGEPGRDSTGPDVDLDDLLDESREVVERRTPLSRSPREEELPFSEVSPDLLDEVEIDVSSFGSRRVTRARPSPVPGSGKNGREAPRRETGLVAVRRDPVAEQISTAYQISLELSLGLCAVARSVGAVPTDLANLVHFESRFDPTSGGPSDPAAVGLVQFTPRTAASIGTSVEALRRMTAVEQISFVKRYLDFVRRGRHLDTPHRLYMAVFFPDAIEWDPSRPFPEDLVRKNTYESNGEIVSIRCPADYARRLEWRAKIPSSAPTPPAPPPSPVEGVLSWFSGVFSGLQNGFGQGPPEGETESAAWTASPGVDAVLVDERGQEWPPGKVPVGRYQLVISGRLGSKMELHAGRRYRASNLGRLFGDVVDS